MEVNKERDPTVYGADLKGKEQSSCSSILSVKMQKGIANLNNVCGKHKTVMCFVFVVWSELVALFRSLH